MRLKTIFLIAITILLTVVIMQNNTPVSFKILFFSTYISKLAMLLIVAVVGFIIGFLVGRPKVKRFGNNYGHGYDEGDETTHEGLSEKRTDTLSAEDRDYIS